MRVSGRGKFGPCVGSSFVGVLMCTWAMPVMNLPFFLATDPCPGCLILHREGGAFSLDAAVVDRLRVLKVKAVVGFSSIHPNKRSGLSSPDCSLVLAKKLTNCQQKTTVTVYVLLKSLEKSPVKERFLYVNVLKKASVKKSKILLS